MRSHNGLQIVVYFEENQKETNWWWLIIFKPLIYSTTSYHNYDVSDLIFNRETVKSYLYLFLIYEKKKIKYIIKVSINLGVKKRYIENIFFITVTIYHSLSLK